MKGGNGANAVSGITQFAEGEPKRLKGDKLYCVSRKRPLDGACLGRQLDGGAVKLFFLLRTDVRDPEWFSAAAKNVSGSLEKATASRRTPHKFLFSPSFLFSNSLL